MKILMEHGYSFRTLNTMNDIENDLADWIFNQRVWGRGTSGTAPAVPWAMEKGQGSFLEADEAPKMDSVVSSRVRVHPEAGSREHGGPHSTGATLQLGRSRMQESFGAGMSFAIRTLTTSGIASQQSMSALQQSSWEEANLTVFLRGNAPRRPEYLDM